MSPAQTCPWSVTSWSESRAQRAGMWTVVAFQMYVICQCQCGMCYIVLCGKAHSGAHTEHLGMKYCPSPHVRGSSHKP